MCTRSSSSLDETAMRNLLERMICPNPLDRIDARDANRHKALNDESQVDLSTPPFVRTAASLPIDTRAKKQLPREKREQKRSQALQAETGAKFVADNRVVEPLPDRKPNETEMIPALRLNAEFRTTVTAATREATQQTKLTENEPQQNKESKRNSHRINASPAVAETPPRVVAGHAPLGKSFEPPISLKPEPGTNACIHKHQSADNTGKP